MSYKEAYDLNIGDNVIVIGTEEQRTVEEISGTSSHLFILLDDGCKYRHDQLMKN